MGGPAAAGEGGLGAGLATQVHDEPGEQEGREQSGPQWDDAEQSQPDDDQRQGDEQAHGATAASGQHGATFGDRARAAVGVDGV